MRCSAVSANRPPSLDFRFAYGDTPRMELLLSALVVASIAWAYFSDRNTAAAMVTTGMLLLILVGAYGY